MHHDDCRLSAAITAMEQEDFDASFELVEQLASEGRAMAQHFLGWHYHKGLGVTQDDVKAVYWWRKAAILGVPEAQLGLGWAYETGRGVQQDRILAYQWYGRAVTGGDQEARISLMELALQLSADQVREAEGLPPVPSH